MSDQLGEFEPMETRPARDECDFIDVLEEAAVGGTPVKLTLKDGRSFDTRVRDVVTRDHQNLAVLEDGRELPVSELRDARRSDEVVRRV